MCLKQLHKWYHFHRPGKEIYFGLVTWQKGARGVSYAYGRVRRCLDCRQLLFNSERRLCNGK